MQQQFNPYSAPSVTIGRSTEEFSELESVRLEYLSHEAALKAVGSLFLIISALVSSLMTIFTSKFLNEELLNNERTFVLSYWVLVPISLYIGIKMRRLDHSIRNTVVIAGALMMFAFPFGTIVGSGVLYVVCCKKGKFILSQRYTNIRYRTPGIHYETKLFTKIFTIAISVSVSLFVIYYVSPLFREFLNLSF